MSDNPFDTLNELAPSQNYGERNPFDDIHAQEVKESERQLKLILNSVSTLDPDRTGEAQKLAERLNLPPGIALDSDETLNLLRERNKEQDIYGLDLAATNPILMRHLTDPNFAAIAQDNVEQLGLIEGTFTGIKDFPESASQGWEKGRLEAELGQLGFTKGLNAQTGKPNEQVDARIAEINSRIEELEGDGSGMWENTFGIGGQWSRTLQEGAKYGAAGAATGGSLGLLGGPFAPITVKGGAITGFLWGTTTGTAKEAFRIEAGHQYNSLIEMGISHETARNVGLAVGLVNGALEFTGVGFVAAPLKTALIRGLTKEVTKALVRPTLGGVIRQTARIGARNWATEVATEGAQELVNIAGEEFAQYFEKDEFEFLIQSEKGRQQINQRLLAILEKVGTGMIPLAGLSAGPTFYSGIRNVQTATKETAFIDSLTNLATTDKTKVRNPSAFQNYIQNVADGNDVPNIFVDAEVFNQQLKNNGITMDQLEAFSPEIANDLKEINKAGGQGDIAIPTGDYATRVAGTPLGNALQPHMRVTQDSMSAIEAGQFVKDRESLKQEAEQILNDQKKLDAEFRKEAADVKANIAAQLKATNVYRPNQITALSTFVRDFVITQANQLGITPSEFFNKYFYNITTQDGATGPARQQLSQETTDDLYGASDNLDDLVDETQTGEIVPYERAIDAEVIPAADTELGKIADEIEEIGNRAYQKDTGWMPGKPRPGRLSDQLRDMLKTATDADAKRLRALDEELKNLDKESKESDQKLFEQRQKQRKGKPVPAAIVEIAKLVNTFDFAGQKQYATNRDFKVAIQERLKAEAKKAGVDLSVFTVETEKYLVQTLLEDAKFALETNPNAVGWYNEKVTKALSLLSLIHPEIATNPQSKFAFTWALANTSNGLKVDKNFELAEKAYAYYSENGVMPTDIGIGDASAAINNNMKLFNRLLEEKGFEDFEQFMKTMHTVKDVEAYTGSNVSGENKTEMVYGAAVMGPKIGNGFFANLYGNFEQLTMDRWLMRTWGRMTGTLVTDYKKQAKTKREQLKPLIKGLTLKDKKAFEAIIGIKIKLSNLDEAAIAIQKASTKPANRKAMAQIATIENETNAELITEVLGEPKKNIVRIGIGDELRKGGIALAKFNDGQKESPNGPVERRQIRKVFNQALSILQQDERLLTMADLQALIWYPEKRLYDSAKLNEAEQNTGYQDNEAPDYSNAAINLAQQLGVSDADIQTTLQEVNNELERQAVERTRGGESGEGTGGTVQRDNTDEATGLPLNADGTVTVFHHTDKQSADSIRESGELRSAGEPDVYVTTRNIPDTGYGDTAVGLRVEPSRLSLDDEFPNGRRDFRLSVGEPGGSLQVEVVDFAEESRLFSQQQVPGQQLFNQDGSVRLNSSAFKKFFGDSKLVNKDGLPQVLYHGTADNISEFNLDHPHRKDTGWLGTGVYLTDSPDLAKYYADIKAQKKKQGRLPDDGVRATILPLYARLENPYRATLEEKDQIRTGKISAEGFREKLIADGHDGVIMPIDNDNNEIVVFDTRAVKSTFNSGTWSRETGNLLRQSEKQSDYYDADDPWWKKRVLDAANFVGEGVWKAEEKYYALREEIDWRLYQWEQRDAEKTQERIERELAEFNALFDEEDIADLAWREIPEGQTRRRTIPVGGTARDGAVFVERTDLTALQHIANQKGILNKILAGFVLATGNLPHSYAISVGGVMSMPEANLKELGLLDENGERKKLSNKEQVNILKANFDRVRGELPVGLYNMWGSSESRRKLYHRWFKNDPDVVWVDQYTGERKTSREALENLEDIIPHLLITDWTKTYKQQVFHGTSPEAAALIVSTGVDFSSKDYGIMGEGFYVTTDRDYATVYGPEVVEGLLPDSAKILDITGQNAFQWAEEVGIGKPTESVDMESHIQEYFSDEQKDQIVQWAKDNNYDGIKFDPNPLVMGVERTADEALIPEIVLFNKDLANQIVKKQQEYFSQGQADARGQFDPSTLTTILGKNADISTFFHETAHYMLTVMEDIAMSEQASQKQKDDFQALLDFFGVKDVEAWGKLSLGEKRPHHEAFAYNYEIYLYEGKAPNIKLQELFDQFSRWLRRIYKSIRDELNPVYREENGVDLPILTDEIRSVMDRMLASEDQIAQAETVYGMKAMFQTQEQSGMNDEQWAEYTAAQREANDLAITDLTKATMRQVKWLSNARSKVLKKLQKEAAETRKIIIEEETDKIEKEKVYRLQSYLKRGETLNDKGEVVKVEGSYKLSIESVRNLVSGYDMKSELKKLGTGKYGMVAKEGQDVLLVAEMFGYKDPFIMIDALVNIRPMKEVLMERVDQRMLNEHSDINDARKQELQVQEAIHNEARSRFISVELRALSKSMQPVRYQVAAARQVAREILAGKKLSEIRPSQFSRNEVKAVRAAEEAMKKGDTLAAIKAKKSQLLNNQLTREAVKVHKEYDKAQKLFKQIFKADKKIAKTRNTDLVNVARSILAAYQVGPAVDKPSQYTDKLQAYNPDMFEQLKPIIEELTVDGGQDIKELTLDKFRTVHDMIQTLWYQSRRDKQVEIDGKKMEIEEIAGELLVAMSRMKTPVQPGTTEAPGKKARFVRGLQQGKSILRRVEHWADGMDGATQTGEGLVGGVVLKRDEFGAGPFTKYIWRPVKDALNKYRIERANYTKQYSEMLSRLDIDKKPITSDELGYTFGNESGGQGKLELLGAMLHTGNESNLRKLLLGRKGWGERNEDGSVNTSRWDAFIDRMKAEGILTAKDYQFMQDVWDLNERMKPLLQKAHMEVFGYYFKEIEATPIVNRFGSFRGGYVPAKTDPFMVTETKLKEQLEDLRGEFRQSLPSTGHGFTKERVEYNKPLSLDLRLMTKHIDDAIRFAFVQPAIEDVFKILKHRKFAERLEALDATVMNDMLRPWLNRSARQITVTGDGSTAWNSFWSTVRSRTGINIMFANVRNALQQLTGYFPAMLKVEPKYLQGGLATYLKNPMKQQQEIAEMSPFMAERQSNQIYDIQDSLNELLINPNRYEQIQRWSKKHGYFIQQAFQNQVDTVVWAATYNKVLAEAPKGMSDLDVQKEAIQQADANVRLTQDSLQAEDLAAFQVGSPFYKTFVQFTGYFNMLANLNATQYKKLFKDLGWRGTKGQLFMTYLLGFAMPAFVAELIVKLTGGDLDDEDEDGYLDDVAGWFFGSQLRAGAALFPGGSALLVPLNALNDLPYDDRITTSPSVSTLEAGTTGTVRALINIADPSKDVTGKNVRDVLTFLSLVTGIPMTVLGRPIGYQVDVDRGKVDPTGLPDHLRGLVTGKASRRSRE